MALRKEIEMPSGQIVSYWKIPKLPLDNDEHRTAAIKVVGYLTKRMRDENKDPVVESMRTITCKDEKQYNKEQYTKYMSKEALANFAINVGMDIYKVAYRFLTEESEMFEDAWECQDCTACLHKDECPDANA